MSILGRFDLYDGNCVCSNCHYIHVCTSPSYLVMGGYWPGTCSIGAHSFYVFSQDVFVFYDLLKNNSPGLSEHSFIHALEQFSEMNGRVSAFLQQAFILVLIGRDYQ